jgi:hypothetical protein
MEAQLCRTVCTGLGPALCIGYFLTYEPVHLYSLVPYLFVSYIVLFKDASVHLSFLVFGCTGSS